MVDSIGPSMEERRAALAASAQHLRGEAAKAKAVAEAAAADCRFSSDREMDERRAALAASAARLTQEAAVDEQLAGEPPLKDRRAALAASIERLKAEAQSAEHNGSVDGRSSATRSLAR